MGRFKFIDRAGQGADDCKPDGRRHDWLQGQKPGHHAQFVRSIDDEVETYRGRNPKRNGAQE